MRHHHGIHTRRDRLPKRRQFDRVEVGAINIDAGDAEMRVGRRVSVAGKMFDRSQHPPFVRALDIRRDQVADLLRIFSEGARIDDGIHRVRVNVGVGEKIPVNTNGARLFGRNAPERLGIFGFAIPAESHGVWKDSRPHQPHRHPTFKVGGKK